MKRRLWSAALLLWVAGPACDPAAPLEPQDGGSAAPVRQVSERGPVQLTVTADPGEITIADPLLLTLEVQADDGVEVIMPQFGDHLDEFTIRDFRNWPAIPQNGARLWKQEYDLEIFLSGEYTIPEIQVDFVDRRDGSALESTVVSEPLTVQVHSLMEGQFDPTQFRDIKGTVELPDPPRSWSVSSAVAVAGGVMTLLAALFWWRRQHRHAAVEPPVPAHTWALEQLHRLDESGLREQGQVQEFYFRLSAIVRAYIERRFGVMASEQTTEEFLRAMGGDAVLGPRYGGLLQGFLQACDLVKFARHQPDGGEIEQVRTTAFEFVQQSAEPDIREEAA